MQLDPTKFACSSGNVDYEFVNLSIFLRGGTLSQRHLTLMSSLPVLAPMGECATGHMFTDTPPPADVRSAPLSRSMSSH